MLQKEEAGEGNNLAEVYEVEAYKLLPLRHVSRLWGFINGEFMMVLLMVGL